jgi:hypothetical protein
MHPRLAQRIHSSKPIAMLLLILMLTIPLSVHAAPYVYTYIGKPFTNVFGPDFPAPSPSYRITAEFTYDGVLLTGVNYAGLTTIKMSDGVHTFSSSDPNVSTSLTFSGVFSEGLPEGWALWMADNSIQWQLDSEFYNVSPGYVIQDGTGSPNWTYANGACIFDQPGIWSRVEANSSAPVPIPATMMLLGSGFISLAGFRKKFKK